MKTHRGVILPPSAGDLRCALEALDWPIMNVGGRMIAGAPAWQEALASASPELRRRLWESLGSVKGPAEPAVLRRLYLDTATRPTQHEVATFRWAETFVARHGGLRIPPTAYVVAWFRGWENSNRGMMVYDRRPFEVLLKTGLDEEELFEMACHELRHLADHALYPGRYDDPDEREARAEAFGARMLQKRRELVAEAARVFGRR